MVIDSQVELLSNGGVMVSCDDDEAPRKSSDSNGINDSVSDKIHNMAEKFYSVANLPSSSSSQPSVSVCVLCSALCFSVILRASS